MAQACSTSSTATPIESAAVRKVKVCGPDHNRASPASPNSRPRRSACGHVVRGETEARQVLDETGPRAWIVDPSSLHGVEVQGIDHLAKCASRLSH